MGQVSEDRRHLYTGDNQETRPVETRGDTRLTISTPWLLSIFRKPGFRFFFLEASPGEAGPSILIRMEDDGGVDC